MVYLFLVILIFLFFYFLIIQYVNLGQRKIPKELPLDLKNLINDLRGLEKREIIKKLYLLFKEKYQGSRIKTITKFFEIFNFDLEKIWQTQGFVHCTAINYLLKIILLNLGFKKEDIKLQWTNTWYIYPHQYFKVKIQEQWIDIDIWASFLGTKFADHAHGFHV